MTADLARALPRRNTLLAALFCTTSFSALAATTAVHAQTPSNTAPVEEVLVTGSLIRGAEAVGVPVTALDAKDFQDSGHVTVADILRSVPSIFVAPSTTQAATGGNEIRTQAINIHQLGGLRNLMLIDGMRYPLQNQNASKYDPSIIPTLAIQRVDVLADGASATYGADATSGVVNLILKRGYDGAVTQFHVGTARGATDTQEAQLFGRTWDSGDITLTFQHYETAAIKGSELDFYTTDFTPWGLDNESSIKASIPGIVSTGAPNATLGTGCTNCYSVPKGQNGTGLT